MKIMYEVARKEGNIFLRGQIVSYEVDEKTPSVYVSDILHRCAMRPSVVRVWVEL